MNPVDKIQEILKSKNIKPYKMMKDLGFSSGLFSQWTSGKQQISLEKIVSIANYFNVSVDYLLGRTYETGEKKVTDNSSAKYQFSNQNFNGTVNPTYGDHAHNEIKVDIKNGTSSDTNISNEAIEYDKILSSLNADDRELFIIQVNSLATAFKKKRTK